MDNETFYPDGPTRVLKVLKDVFQDYFKGYADGLAEELPASYLPCVMATSSDGTIQGGATGTDDILEEITIVVVLNERDYLDPNSGMTNRADVALRRLVMGQNPTSKEYMPNTIMYALRKHFTLNDGAVNNRITFNMYPSQRGEQLNTRECELKLSITRYAMVPSRD